MISLSRRQFSTLTLLGGLGALAAPRSFAAQTENVAIAQPISVAQPTISINVNNVALTFLVDTTSPYSSINPDVASWLGLTPTGEQTIPGPGPTLQAQLYGATLASGGATFPFQLAAVEDLSLVSEPVGSPPEMEGILGADFLGQFSSFSLTDTSFTGVIGSTSETGLNGAALNGAALNRTALNAALPPPFTVTYPVFKIGNKYYVLIEIIDGSGRRVTELFLLDTGATVSALSAQAALNLGLLPLFIGPNPFPLVAAMVPIRGVGGVAIGMITPPVGLPGFGMVNFIILDLPVAPGVAGVIGADVLGNSFIWQQGGAVGTITITNPLGQLVQFFIGLFRFILRAIGITATNLKIE